MHGWRCIRVRSTTVKMRWRMFVPVAAPISDPSFTGRTRIDKAFASRHLTPNIVLEAIGTGWSIRTLKSFTNGTTKIVRLIDLPRTQ